MEGAGRGCSARQSGEREGGVDAPMNGEHAGPGVLRSQRPLVSIIMPSYNPGAYLRAAVEGLLAQTYPHWELVLVDDGSTDGSLATLEDIDDSRIRRIRQPNSGKPVAMNRGLALARGEYYALHDADDLSHPFRVERQLECLLAHPRLAGVFCGHELIVDGQVVAPTFRAKTEEQCSRDIEHGHMPAHDPTGMFRMALVRGIRFAEDLPIVEGHDYILRVGEQFPLMVLGECLYSYRIHAESVTRRDPTRRMQLSQEVIDRMCDRRGQPRRARPGRRQPASRHWELDNDIVSHFTASVADLVMSGRQLSALRTGFAGWRLHPADAYYAKPLLYALLPRPLMKRYRRVKERRSQRAVRAFQKVGRDVLSLAGSFQMATPDNIHTDHDEGRRTCLPAEESPVDSRRRCTGRHSERKRDG